MKKRVLALVLTLTMIISMFPLTAFGSEFSDMPDNWATEALENAVANGLLKGDNKKIMPDENLTRAQMATIVNRAFGATEKSSLSKFTDVNADAWYYAEMAKAVHMKTFVGAGDKLNPNSSITREEAFTVLSRAFKLSAKEDNVLDKFSDKNLISDWAIESVSSLISAGYVAGSNGQLNPKQFITRAEFAQVMYNLIKNYVNESGTYTTDYKGNVMVNEPDVTLKNLTVKGDLIIGDGVGNGTVTLDSVTVTGRTVLRGGGENSIRIIGNSNIQNIIIARVDG
ncbi:MAG: S-layer homology domain-containing protein, partial [Prolixibacteraceae bacterium]|nr:S-layer homology domain-containing protein [Prolixibacteraceae bacterium]